MRIHSFQIITSNPERNAPLASGIASTIETRGGSCSISYVRDDDYSTVIIDPKAECVFSIGGDGTLIAVAAHTVERGVPLIGVNRGHMGYLCDLDEDSVYDAIDTLMEGSYDLEERMMLEGTLVRKDGTRLSSSLALNDIVVSSMNGLQVIGLSVYVGDEFLYSFNGDGMILATPTGSTAYNLSANGPIVDPKTDVILMTPINPHTLTNRSIIIDRRDEVSIEIKSRRYEEAEYVAVSFDGGRCETMRPGDRIVVHRANARTKMIRLSKMSFLERIRRKMITD